MEWLEWLARFIYWFDAAVNGANWLDKKLPDKSRQSPPDEAPESD